MVSLARSRISLSILQNSSDLLQRSRPKITLGESAPLSAMFQSAFELESKERATLQRIISTECRRKISCRSIRSPFGDDSFQIICLQEVQADHYQYDFRPTMIAYGTRDELDSASLIDSFVFVAGYESIYTKRSGEKCDGCCILYRIDRLKLVASQAVPFYREGIPILDR